MNGSIHTLNRQSRRYGQFGSTPSIGARGLPAYGLVFGLQTPTICFDLPNRQPRFDLPNRQPRFDLRKR